MSAFMVGRYIAMLKTILEDHNPWWRDASQRRAKERPWRRDWQRNVLQDVQRADRRAILLCGPRQVGKTVGLLQLADDLLDRIAGGMSPSHVLYFDFSDDRLTSPSSPRDVLAAAPPVDGPRFVLFDELTSCLPPWDVWLKQAVDAGGMRIVATDSSASLLRAEGRESGLGRWDEWHVETLTFREWCGLRCLEPDVALQTDPALLERYLRTGGFPEHARPVADEEQVRRRLRSDLMDKAVRRDLRRLGLSRGLDRLFPYLIESSGEEFKATERGRDLDLDRRTVDSGVDAFLDAGLLRAAQRWATRPAARLRATMKIHAADHGMIVAFAAVPAPWDDNRTRARTFEAVVFRHLRELAYRIDEERRDKVFYYRDDRGLEADFVLADGPVVVEVTSSREPDRAKIASTSEVMQRLKARRGVIVHGGVSAGHSKGVDLLPIHQFLLQPDALVTP